MNYALIMAGGIGSRLWPVSRQHRPKQALKLIGDGTMFEHAVDRIAPVFDRERVMVVTRASHVAPLSSLTPTLPIANFVVEPEGRGTAPAIGLGAIHLHKRDPDAVMAVLTADHFIADTDGFCRALSSATELAQAGHLVTLGIQPTLPATGFGYIEEGKTLDSVNDFPVFRVNRFVEKPDLGTATQMVNSGKFAWNSGMFVWRVDRILAEFKRQMPEFYAQLMEIEAVVDGPDYAATLGRVWPKVAAETIDYGVMEGAEGVVVIPVDIGWSDIGSWDSVEALLESDEEGNTVTCPHVNVDTRNTFVFGDKRLIATIGVEDLIIVDTEDALLICRKDREQDVKSVVSHLEQDQKHEWL